MLIAIQTVRIRVSIQSERRSESAFGAETEHLANAILCELQFHHGRGLCKTKSTGPTRIARNTLSLERERRRIRRVGEEMRASALATLQQSSIFACSDRTIIDLGEKVLTHDYPRIKVYHIS